MTKSSPNVKSLFEQGEIRHFTAHLKNQLVTILDTDKEKIAYLNGILFALLYTESYLITSMRDAVLKIKKEIEAKKVKNDQT